MTQLQRKALKAWTAQRTIEFMNSFVIPNIDVITHDETFLFLLEEWYGAKIDRDASLDQLINDALDTKKDIKRDNLYNSRNDRCRTLNDYLYEILTKRINGLWVKI